MLDKIVWLDVPVQENQGVHVVYGMSHGPGHVSEFVRVHCVRVHDIMPAGTKTQLNYQSDSLVGFT